MSTKPGMYVIFIDLINQQRYIRNFSLQEPTKINIAPVQSLLSVGLVLFISFTLMTAEEFKRAALSYPSTTESNHFDRIAFKVVKKRIFATLHETLNSANIKLSPVVQSVFCSIGKNAIYAVPNKWGNQGWTTFELQTLPAELVSDALQIAYQEVFMKKLK